MGNINFDFNFWTLSVMLMNLFVVIFVAFTNRGKAKADELAEVKKGLHGDIQELGKTVNKQGERLAAIESEVENGLTKEDMSAMYERINSVASSTDRMQGQLGEMSKSMTRIDEHLMQLIRRDNHG